MAARATLALKAGEWFRRGRLLMVSPVHGDYRRCQAEIPLIVLSKLPRPALSITGRLLHTLQASLLDLADLITDEPPALHVAMQLSQRVGRYWFALGRAQIFKAPGGLLQLGIEAADAQPDQRCFHSVDNPSLLSDEALALAVGQLGVETVGLGAPVLARHGYARCVDNVGLDAACSKPARQPETVPAGLK